MVIDFFVVLMSYRYVNANRNNVDNLNSVKCEASRHFRNEKKEYLKAKIDEVETDGKASTCECGNGASGSIKCSEFLD